MSQEEPNSPPQVPESPRRITEISFTSFASRLERLEQSETKGDPREKGKIFWLRITRDVTKIHEMQNVFKYLRYAQVGPTIKRVRTQTFFNRWKRAITSHKWIEVASKLRDQIRVNEFKDSANRISYVRSKLTKENYTKKHQFVPDFTFISNMVTYNTIQPIKQLSPAEALPVKDEYEYEEEYEEEESKEIPTNQNKIPSSPQRSRTTNQMQFQERAVTLHQENEEKEEEEEEKEIIEKEPEEIITEELEKPQQEVVPEKKKSSKLWIILAALILVGAIVAAFVFLGKGKINGLKSFENVDDQIIDEIPTETTTEPTPIPEVTPEDVTTETAAPGDATPETSTNQTNDL